MKEILVSDIMTRFPVTIAPETNLLECAKKMVRKRVGALLITNKKDLVGFISQRDILWALIKKSQKSLSDIKAGDISPKKLGTIKPEITIEQAIKRMNKLKFDRLPVVQGKELVGIITAKDILNFKPEFYPEISEYNKIREEWQKLRRVKKAREKEIRSEGLCEECGNNEFLFKVNGMLICESCRNSI